MPATSGLGPRLDALLTAAGRMPRRGLLTLALGCIVLLGLADFLTGPLLSFALFYLVPVLVVTWVLGSRDGIGVALVAALAWVSADVAGRNYSLGSPVAYWNGAVLLAVLLVVVLLLTGLRRSLLREQDLLREIQQRLLPSDPPSLPGCQVVAVWRPAAAVGGDYYDVLALDDGSAGLCIADVAGKGVAAALLMSNLQAALRSVASTSLSPASLCARLNAVICRNVRVGSFITFFYGRLDAIHGHLVYTNAGHNPPFLVRAAGGAMRLDTGGPVLGVFPDASFAEQEVSVGRGDRLVLYTDGVTERSDSRGSEFGEERLLAVLEAARGLPAAALVDRIERAVEMFAPGPAQDDLTVLVASIDGGVSPGATGTPVE